jgi:hypothetical protein
VFGGDPAHARSNFGGPSIPVALPSDCQETDPVLIRKFQWNVRKLAADSRLVVDPP